MPNKKKFVVTTFYKFHAFDQEQLPALETQLVEMGQTLHLRGLVILATEGINATLSGSAESITSAKQHLLALVANQPIFFKDSPAANFPFHDFKVKIRSEIVTLDRPGLVPRSEKHNHLSPDEWQQALQDDGTMVLDTRNDYEVKIGKFKKAINPKLREFTEFPEYLKKSGLNREQKILIYCTGGIRCEKAILEMNRQGYSNVFQLDGGIINYLKEFPEQEFEGECFVFDYRVAVDQKLNPSQKYRLCPHCGNPGLKKIQCIQCKTEEIICEDCSVKDLMYNTCSKNCAHHYRMGHRSKRPHLDSQRKRQPSHP